MLQYLIILLDESSISYCHYENTNISKKLIPLEVLKKGIRFSMMENLLVQFVYPDYKLPIEYEEIIDSIEHSKFLSSINIDENVKKKADVVVFNDWENLVNYNFNADVSYVLRVKKIDLFTNFSFLKQVFGKITRLNIVITDIETFKGNDFEQYSNVLSDLSKDIEKLYVKGNIIQFNLLTDRMLLSHMNNCGAGETNLTLAPNGKFYICPAFYYDSMTDCIGDLEHGIDIKNKNLYHLDYAPICCHCDAWQCKRCIWLNAKTTLEVNTPSHEQCVIAHLERNASKRLLETIRKQRPFYPEQKIEEIDYLDPFDKRNEWQ